MAGFENEFLNHIYKSSHTESETVMLNGKVKKKKDVLMNKTYRMVLKKYRRQWWGLYSNRKKSKFRGKITVLRKVGLEMQLDKKSQKHDLLKKFSSGHSWPSLIFAKSASYPEKIRKEGSPCQRRHSFDESLIQKEMHCTDFPISEMGPELSGNRGNGNSPFNSSNSCGSPEDCSSNVSKQEQNIVCNDGHLQLEQNNNSEEGKVQAQIDCNEVSMDFSLQENHDRLQTKITFPKLEENAEMSEKILKDMDEQSCDGISELSPNLLVKSGESLNKNVVLEPLSDVKMLEGSFDVPMTQVESNKDQAGQSSDDDGLESDSLEQVRSSQQTRKESFSWQQQFMSFLSTNHTSDNSESTEDQDDPDFVCNTVVTPSKSSRRQRQRQIRNSVCSCCIGSSSHKKGERHSHYRGKRLLREQKHFIRDTIQLLSLRNKIIKLLQTLVPDSFDQFINPGTESLDEFVDCVLRIIKSSCEDRSDESIKMDVDHESAEIGSTNSPHVKSSEMFDIQSEDIDGEHDLPVFQDFMSNNSHTKSHIETTQVNGRVHQSLSDSGIVHDQSSFLETSCERVSNSMLNSEKSFNDTSDTNIHGMEKDGNTVLPVYAVAYLGTEVINIPNGTYDANLIRDSCEKNEESSFLNSSAAISTEGSINVIDSPAKLFSDDLDIQQKSEVHNCVAILHDLGTSNENLGNLNSESESLIQNVQINDHISECHTLETSTEGGNVSTSHTTPVLEKLASVLHNYESDRNQTTRSDPLMEILAENNTLEFSKSAIQNSSSIESTQLTSQSSSRTFPISHTSSDLTSAKPPAKCNEKIVEVYEPSICLCKKPKFCLKVFKKKIHSLLHRLLPGVHFEHHFFKNTDNLEFLLDAIIHCNQQELTVQV